MRRLTGCGAGGGGTSKSIADTASRAMIYVTRATVTVPWVLVSESSVDMNFFTQSYTSAVAERICCRVYWNSCQRLSPGSDCNAARSVMLFAAVTCSMDAQVSHVSKHNLH